jgi:hypothetical protein
VPSNSSRGGSIALTDDVIAKVDLLARMRGLSRSATLRALIEDEGKNGSKNEAGAREDATDR